ncbi:katanin [Novymonas esmeraldas]|uniref:Katanin n=1 Tax=Novymonas esmeraldas TaxID=1808958 RepID=A0AAW0F5G2_9TRYP
MFAVSEHRLPCDALYARISSSRSKPLVGFGGRDASIHVYPFLGQTRSAWLQGLSESVTALAFDPDQSCVVGGSDAGKLQMWDLGSEEVVRVFTRGHASTVTDVDVFRSGQFFATVATDKILRIWDMRKSSGRQSYKDATSPLCAVQFSPNGRWVATGCARGTVRLYDLVAGQLLRKLELHSGAITSLHFHPDLYYLAVGSGDGTVSMWDLDSFEARFHSSSQRTPIDAVRFCGTRLLATSDHNLRIFDMTNLRDRTAVSLEAPWMMMGDVAYASATDEAWFVETSGSTAMKCKLSLRDVQRPQEEDTASPATALPLQRVPAAAASSGISPIFAEARQTPASGSPHSPSCSSADGTEHATSAAAAAAAAAAPTFSGGTHPRPPWVSGGPSFPAAPSAAPTAGCSEVEMLEQLSREHSTVTTTLERRLDTLRTMRGLWLANQPEAMVYVRRLYEEGQEFGPLFDFLTVLQQHRMKEKMLTDTIAGVMELIEIALKTDYEPLIVLALRTLRSIAAKFRARMEEAQRRARSSQSTGYNDPLGTGQHRHITERLLDCCPMVFALAERRDTVGEEARAVLPDLPPPPRTQ